MKIELNPAKMKKSTVALLLALGGAFTVFQAQSYRDKAIAALHDHPHLISLVNFLFALIVLLHNPKVRQILMQFNSEEENLETGEKKTVDVRIEAPVVEPGVESPQESPTPTGATDMKKPLLLVLVSALVLGAATGCDSFERAAFKTLSSSKAVIDTAAADYNSHSVPQTTVNRDLIDNARKVQQVGVDALQAYDQVLNTKGHTDSQLADVQAKVQAALTSLAPLVADIRAFKGVTVLKSKQSTVPLQLTPLRLPRAA